MKTFCRKISGNFFLLFLAGCFSFLTFSCGLDVYYVMEAPEISRTANYSTEDWTERFCSFVTPVMEDTEFKFLGTDIYYKIYNNVSEVIDGGSGEAGKLYNMSVDDDNKMNSASRMIDTYGYLPIRAKGNSHSPLIPSASKKQLVKIRLTNYGKGDSKEGIAGITVSDIGSSNETPFGVPLRASEVGDYTFDFGRSLRNDSNKFPLETDQDVKIAAQFTENGTFYVALFAVAVGLDTITYTRNYSNIVYLGSFAIDANSEDN